MLGKRIGNFMSYYIIAYKFLIIKFNFKSVESVKELT